MVSFLDFMLPQNTGLNSDQMNYLDRSGLMNAASTLADLSAPHYGPAATPMQLIAHGMSAYQGGAQGALNQFYENNTNRAKSAADAVQEYVDKDNLNWFNNQNGNQGVYPKTSVTPGVAPTLQDFYKNNLTPSQVRVESGGNPNAVSPKGAQGLMQIMPETAKAPGFGVTPMQNDSPAENLRVGQDYTDALLKKYQDPSLALMAYNWGPGNVDNWVASGKDPNAVPAETKAYVQNVLGGQSSPEQSNPLAAYYSGDSNGGMAKKFYDMAERQMRANRPGADGLYKLGAMYDPNMEKVNKSGLPAVIQIADEMKRARASGDTQRMKDLETFAKTSTLDSGDAVDPNLTGQEFLKSLPRDEAAITQLIGDGKEKSSVALARFKPDQRARILANVSQYTGGKYNARQFDATADFNNGPHGDQVRYVDNAVGHINTARPLIAALQNGDTQLFNRVAQAWAEQTGSPAPTNLETAGNIIGQEMVKAIIPAGGSAGERDEAQKAFNTAKSPTQLLEALDTVQKIMGRQLNGLNRTYKLSTERDDFNKYLSPDTQKILSSEQMPENDPASGWQTSPSGVKFRIVK